MPFSLLLVNLLHVVNKLFEKPPEMGELHEICTMFPL